MSDPRTLTPDDVLALRSVTDVQLSPDGETVAFVVADSFKEETKHPRSRIWTVPAKGGTAHPFTSGTRADTTPRWSPDGASLAFLSDRKEDGKAQLYLLPSSGGEAEALTDERSAVSGIRWSPDGTEIGFLMTDPETEDERKRKEEKDDAIEFERSPKFRRLYTLNLTTREVRRVTGDYQVWEYDWAPRGREFALIVSDLPYNWSWYNARLARVAGDGGSPETVLETRRQLARPLWSPDGKRLAYLSCTWSDAGVIGGDLWVIPAGGGEPRNLTEGYPGSVTWMEWTADGRGLFLSAHEGGEIALVSQELEPPERRTLWRAEATVAERAWARFSSSGSHSLFAVAMEDAEHPRDVWLGSRAGDGIQWRQLTTMNPQVDGFALGRTETVHWSAPDGLRIQGLLVLPVGYEEGRKYPLVALVHGGPASLWPHRFNAAVSLWSQLLAANGIASILPNPRGSTGWGVPFTEANLGDMGGRDWEDIEAGVDFCVEHGIADPERLGIGGWSYGGFMTAWAVSRTARFRAAVMGAGICNWRSFHGTTDIGTWDALFYRADPYERGGAYDRFSALSYADRLSTPTLILHGEKDTCVPVGQAYEFFRALKDRGVESELVIYPREEHGIIEKRHQADVMRRVLAWYERHLKG